VQSQKKKAEEAARSPERVFTGSKNPGPAGMHEGAGRLMQQGKARQTPVQRGPKKQQEGSQEQTLETRWGGGGAWGTPGGG